MASLWCHCLVLAVLTFGFLTDALKNDGTKQLPPMGRAMRSEFLLKEDFILLDHGAYGTYPRATQASLRSFQDRAEANPDLWIRRDVEIEMNKVKAELATFIKAEDPEDLVMIPNTTSGMNAIFRSLLVKMGERILYFSTIYGSMGSLIQYVVDTHEGVSSLVFNVTYPLSNARLLSDFEAFMEAQNDPSRPIRIALIDHISSSPAVILPLEGIIPILRRYNVTVLIDGAHAIGQIPVNVTALAPDYYITNCHKWLYSARGSALMWVAKGLQRSLHPAHITASYSIPANFQEEFHWTGTMDYSPYMTVPTALDFRRDVGGEDAIRTYTHNLALEGGARLAALYGTRVLQEEDQMGSMVDVELPLRDHDDPILTTAWWIDTLLYRFPEVYAPTYKHNGRWWARHSVQIYNDLSDFNVAGRVFSKICEEVNNGNSTSKASGSVASSLGLVAMSAAVLAYEL